LLIQEANSASESASRHADHTSRFPSKSTNKRPTQSRNKGSAFGKRIVPVNVKFDDIIDEVRYALSNCAAPTNVEHEKTMAEEAKQYLYMMDSSLLIRQKSQTLQLVKLLIIKQKILVRPCLNLSTEVVAKNLRFLIQI
jgi:hypothetical protein